MASNHIVTVTDANFDQEVLQSPIPVLVDFWAEWCGPCKMIAPILDEIADEKTGKLKVAKVNVEQSPASAGRFQVRAIPMLLFFKNGEVKEQIVGLAKKQDLIAKADALA
jgi:thioredoxin 1